MTTITVRDVPDDARDELAARAARSGRSMQEYLRATLVELAARPDPSELVARIRARKQLTSSTLTADEIVHLRSLDQR